MIRFPVVPSRDHPCNDISIEPDDAQEKQRAFERSDELPGRTSLFGCLPRWKRLVPGRMDEIGHYLSACQLGEPALLLRGDGGLRAHVCGVQLLS